MKIAIIFEEDYLGVYPSFVEAIRMFSSEGIQVDVLGTSRKSKFPSPPEFDHNVNLFLLPTENEISRDYPLNENVSEEVDYKTYPPKHKPKSAFFKKLIPSSFKDVARKVLANIRENYEHFSFQHKLLVDQFRYFLFVYKHVKKNNYDVVIGVDLGGGTASYLSNRFKPCRKYIYWGLEITEPKQVLWVYKLLKYFESKACQTAHAIITTDEARAKDVCKANDLNFKDTNCLYVPHSPKGFCNQSHSSFFQDLFSLNQETIAIIHCGWIHEVMCSKVLAKESKNWPKEWRLIFHERMKRSTDESYIQEVIKSGDEKTLLSLNPVDYNKIDDVILSSKIGIVIYDSHEKYGTSWISLAKGSGKIAHYLRCGKPVICKNLPGFKEIIEKYKCGIIFDELNEIEPGIKTILNNYEFYQKNALECFKYEYEFSRYFQKVINFLKE